MKTKDTSLGTKSILQKNPPTLSLIRYQIVNQDAAADSMCDWIHVGTSFFLPNLTISRKCASTQRSAENKHSNELAEWDNILPSSICSLFFFPPSGQNQSFHRCLEKIICSQNSCYIMLNFQWQLHWPYGVPGPNSLAASSMYWPSSSALVVLEGSFLSSLS